MHHNSDEYKELKNEYIDLFENVKTQLLKAKQKLPKVKNDKKLRRMITIEDKVIVETSQEILVVG